MKDRITILTNEPFLRQISQPVTNFDANLQNDINELKEYCLNNAVFAMAAIQIGIPKQIIYIKSTNKNYAYNKDKEIKDENLIFINPKIIKQQGKTFYWEACESCIDPNGEPFAALVERPYKIEV